MLVIVGHGPSVLSGLGAVIDSMTVIRLKNGLYKDEFDRDRPHETPAEHFGTRTDYLCARSHLYDHGRYPFWHFEDSRYPRWVSRFHEFSERKRKPSTGLCAVFLALEKLQPESIALIGFDRMLRPDDTTTCKWYKPRAHYGWGHDAHAEHRCLYSLGIPIIDLAREHGAVSGLRPAEGPGSIPGQLSRPSADPLPAGCGAHP